MRRTTLSLLLCCAVLLAGSAAFGADAERIYACKATTGGALRAVSATATCKATEKKLSWSVVGPRGPRGYTGEQGAKGDRGPRGYKGEAGIPVSQSCAAGNYVSGITSTGALTCTPLPEATEEPTDPPPTDSDLDGFPDSEDCAPANPSIHPGATEVGNGVDDDCDTEIDEGIVLDLTAVALNYDAARLPAEVPGSVTLTKPAPDDTAITLQSSNPSVATVPAQVVIPQGQLSAPFSVQTIDTGSATITASLALTEVTAGLTVHAADAVSAVESVTVAPASVGGGTVSGMVTLDLYADAGGAEVSLTSSNTDAAEVPASVTIQAGQTSASFPVTPVGAGSTTITASYSGTQAQTVVNVSGG